MPLVLFCNILDKIFWAGNSNSLVVIFALSLLVIGEHIELLMTLLQILPCHFGDGVTSKDLIRRKPSNQKALVVSLWLIFRWRTNVASFITRKKYSPHSNIFVKYTFFLFLARLKDRMNSLCKLLRDFFPWIDSIQFCHTPEGVGSFTTEKFSVFGNV